jgi:hypothetical protein
VGYTGVDLFEARGSEGEPAITLRSIYQTLRTTGARIRLLPGDPMSAMARAANSMGKVDLVVASSTVERDSLARAWFYVPRILKEDSLVVWEQSGGPAGATGFRLLSAKHVEELARRAGRLRAA